MTVTPRTPARPPTPPLSVAALVLIAAATAGAFWGWIGWDVHRTAAPDGGLQGPLEAWQVRCCVLTLLAIGVGSGLAHRGLELIVAMTGGIAASWAVWALVSTGGTGGGLIGVGLGMVTWGAVAATSALALLTDRRLARRVLSAVRTRPRGGGDTT